MNLRKTGFWKYVSKSTLKREAAVILMLWLLSVSTYSIVYGDNETRMRILDLYAYPICLIFAGAFGLDWISKQTNIAGPPAADDGTPPPDKGHRKREDETEHKDDK